MRGISMLHKNALLANEVGGTLYLALCAGPPRATDTGSTLAEATYEGYARAELLPTTWTTPVNGEVRTNKAVSFAPLTSGSQTIVGWALLTELLAGDLRWFGPTTARRVSLDDPVFTVAAGALALALADMT